MVSIYVKNTGSAVDSYNVSPMVSSHLIDVNPPFSKIVLVEPGGVRNTLSTVTLLGSLEGGSVRFNVTSEADTTASMLTLPVNIIVGYPISLPEFEMIGFIQLLILACVILFLYLSYGKSRKN